jgi:hypothetical protein
MSQVIAYLITALIALIAVAIANRIPVLHRLVSGHSGAPHPLKGA